MAGNSPMYKPRSAKVILNPQNWDRNTRTFSCCDSKTYGLHRKKCTLSSGTYIGKQIRLSPFPTGYIPPDPERRNQGRTYQEYLDIESQKKILRLKCSTKASVYGIPKPVIDNLPFNFRNTEVAENSRNKSYSKTKVWSGPHAIPAASLEEPSLDLEPELLLSED